MKDFPIMAMLQRQANLSEPVEYLIFREVLELACARLVLVLVLDLCLKVTIVCVIHDYAQLAFLRFVNFAESYDVWVVENFENFSLTQSFLALIITHRLNIDLLDDCVLSVGLALHEVGGSEGACAESRDLLVGFVLLLFDHINH